MATYGNRARVSQLELGVRPIAPTYGRPRIQCSSAKCSDHFVIDHHAELFFSQMLSIDPSVSAFRPQPLSVDLTAGTLLKSADAVKEVRRQSHRIYTPDFEVTWASGERPLIVEVKHPGYPGKDDYQEKLELAQTVLDAYGYEFAKFVPTERTSSPLLSNVQTLYQAKVRSIPSLASFSNVELVPEYTTLDEICKSFQIPLGYAPTLILLGIVSVDLFKHQIQKNTPAIRSFGDLEHLCLVRRCLS